MRIVLMNEDRPHKQGYPHKRGQNASSKIRVVCIFEDVFFIGAPGVSCYRTARWRCQKWVPRGKITLVHPSTFMGCPSSQGFIAYNVKVSVQCQCKMHQENHCRICFLHRQCADQKYETSAKMQTVLIFEDASVRVYEDDPHSRTSAPTEYDINVFPKNTPKTTRKLTRNR